MGNAQPTAATNKNQFRQTILAAEAAAGGGAGEVDLEFTIDRREARRYGDAVRDYVDREMRGRGATAVTVTRTTDAGTLRERFAVTATYPNATVADQVENTVTVDLTEPDKVVQEAAWVRSASLSHEQCAKLGQENLSQVRGNYLAPAFGCGDTIFWEGNQYRVGWGIGCALGSVIDPARTEAQALADCTAMCSCAPSGESFAGRGDAAQWIVPVPYAGYSVPYQTYGANPFADRFDLTGSACTWDVANLPAPAYPTAGGTVCYSACLCSAIGGAYCTALTPLTASCGSGPFLGVPYASVLTDNTMAVATYHPDGQCVVYYSDTAHAFRAYDVSNVDSMVLASTSAVTSAWSNHGYHAGMIMRIPSGTTEAVIIPDIPYAAGVTQVILDRYDFSNPYSITQRLPVVQPPNVVSELDYVHQAGIYAHTSANTGRAVSVILDGVGGYAGTTPGVTPTGVDNRFQYLMVYVTGGTDYWVWAYTTDETFFVSEADGFRRPAAPTTSPVAAVGGVGTTKCWGLINPNDGTIAFMAAAPNRLIALDLSALPGTITRVDIVEDAVHLSGTPWDLLYDSAQGRVYVVHSDGSSTDGVTAFDVNVLTGAITTVPAWTATASAYPALLNVRRACGIGNNFLFVISTDGYLTAIPTVAT